MPETKLETTEEEQQKTEKTVKVKLVANIKYNSDRFKKGEEIKIKKSEVESFVKDGLIDER